MSLLARSNSLHRIVLALAALLFIALCLRFWAFTADDAFITFRYARHLAEGIGPTFNASGPRIEGYTTFLWMLLMTMPHLVGMDAVLFSKLVGVAAILATMVIAYYFTLRLLGSSDAENKLVAAAAPLLIATFSGSAIHAVTGMETALDALLVTAFLFSITRLVGRYTHQYLIVTALAALFMSLTRPEGNLIAGVGFAALFFLIPAAERLRFMGIVAGVYILPAALYFLWRYTYYGWLLPLPFYIKVGSSGFKLNGAPDVIAFGYIMIIHIGLLIFFAVPKITRPLIPALLAAVTFIAFFLYASHIMGFDWRFLYPIVPFLFVIAALGLGQLADWLRALHTGRRRLMVLGAAVIVAAGLLSEVGLKLAQYDTYASGLERAHVALGKRLASFDTGGEAHLLAISVAGAVPYYSDWTTIDTFGLNEPHIATTGDHDPAYVLDQHPEVLVVLSYSADTFVPRLDWEGPLYEASLDAGYEHMHTLTLYEGNYLWVMVDPTTPVGEYLRDWEPNAE